MMETMIKQNGLSFNDLEKEIYRNVCELGRNTTAEVLEQYDSYLKENRDKKAYRDKGYRRTTIKTLYGEVTYRRTVYETKDESGIKRHVYLLDETLSLENVGLISENYAALLVSGVTELSYRECAEKVTAATGQSISAMGVWNVIQKLGEKVSQEEKDLVKAHKAGRVRGEKEAPVLFEEADGVWLDLQGKDRKSRKNGAAEMKVAIAYDGWKERGKGRYDLDGKVVAAGFEEASAFHKAMEATIAREYDLEKTDLRLLNGDGAQWIKAMPDASAVFQLDPYHRNKAIQEKINDKRARKDIYEFLEDGRVDELLEYLSIYKDSITEDKWIKEAGELLEYFKTNREGLLPYQKQDLDIPESPEGLCYRNMGTMENHVSSIIAHRMKNRHCAWSIKGGNHLAKILAKKHMGRLYEVTDQLKVPLFEKEKVESILEEITGPMSANESEERIGTGYEYPMKGHMAYLDSAVRGDDCGFRGLAGY